MLLARRDTSQYCDMWLLLAGEVLRILTFTPHVSLTVSGTHDREMEHAEVLCFVLDITRQQLDVPPGNAEQRRRALWLSGCRRNRPDRKRPLSHSTRGEPLHNFGPQAAPPRSCRRGLSSSASDPDFCKHSGLDRRLEGKGAESGVVIVA